MIKWWKNRKLTTKISILGAIVVPLILGFCAFVVSLIGGNIGFLYGLPIEVQKNRLPPSEITEAGFSEPGLLTAKYDGKKYFIFTPNCWKTQNNADSRTIEGVEYPKVQLYFIVIARKEQILVDDITIVLENYSKAPDTKQLTNHEIKLGQYGGGGINFIDLGLIDIFPSNKEFHPSSYKSIKIPEMEALGFELTASFHQPGEYSFHIEMLTRDFWQKEQKLSSKVLELNWVDYPDLKNVAFRDPITFRDIQLELCK